MTQHQWTRQNAKSVLKQRANNTFDWQRQEIQKQQAKGNPYVNFNYAETCEEALQRIERQEKEFYD